MKMRYLGAYGAALMMTTALSAPGFAHEERRYPLGATQQVSLFIGFSTEPAFEDSYNGVELFLSSFDGFCPNGEATQDAKEAPISTRGTANLPDKDVVDMKIDGLYLKKVVKPGGGLGEIAPPGILARASLTKASPLSERFGEPGAFATHFRPTHPGNETDGGAYGFYIKGTIHAGPKEAACPDGSTYPLAPRTVSVNSYFVCNAGVLRGRFNCVAPLQSFPGRPDDGYEPSRAPRSGGGSGESN